MENGKVVFIEDNIHDAELIRLSFKQTGFNGNLIRFDSGLDFISYLENEDPGDIIFVILDMEMPHITGIQVLEQLNKKRLKNFPVIFFTASQNSQNIRYTQELGANAYILKPLDFDAFQRAVKDMWRFFGELNEYYRKLPKLPVS
ncbi:MAG: response regulator [Bacteroidota bacterium]